MKKQLKEIVAGYWKLYPKAKKLYATDDGNVFLDKSPALDHARKSKSKMHEFENPAVAEAAKAKKEADAKAAAEQKMQKAFKKLEETDLSSIDYNPAYDLATDLQLPLTDKKKETVMSALSDAKEKLNVQKHEE